MERARQLSRGIGASDSVVYTVIKCFLAPGREKKGHLLIFWSQSLGTLSELDKGRPACKCLPICMASSAAGQGRETESATAAEQCRMGVSLSFALSLSHDSRPIYMRQLQVQVASVKSRILTLLVF